MIDPDELADLTALVLSVDPDAEITPIDHPTSPHVNVSVRSEAVADDIADARTRTYNFAVATVYPLPVRIEVGRGSSGRLLHAIERYASGRARAGCGRLLGDRLRANDVIDPLYFGTDDRHCSGCLGRPYVKTAVVAAHLQGRRT